MYNLLLLATLSTSTPGYAGGDGQDLLPDQTSPTPPPIEEFAIEVVHGASQIGTSLVLTNACARRANLRPGEARLIYSEQEMLSTFQCKKGTKAGVDFSKGILLVLRRTQQNAYWTHRFVMSRGTDNQLVVQSIFGPTPCSGTAPPMRSPLSLAASQQIFLIENDTLDNVLGAGQHGPQTAFVYEVTLPVSRECPKGIP
jgi:hypothetical protein